MIQAVQMHHGGLPEDSQRLRKRRPQDFEALKEDSQNMHRGFAMDLSGLRCCARHFFGIPNEPTFGRSKQT